MGGLKRAWVAAAAAVGICGGALGGVPAGAQAPFFRQFQNQANLQYLAGTAKDGLFTEARVLDAWRLKPMAGTGGVVYQIQRDGTDNCLKAVAADKAELVPCTANPGKPQRWKLNATPGGETLIESRMYPGQVLTAFPSDWLSTVGLAVNKERGRQYWRVIDSQ
ncbi:hypothetical protein [Streptomyces sp. NPDC102264]|uniref:hypothetical protein n=1 Tax=Streptomyces sp. NPDC102264 TaxID=3366149 RepID=UPI00380FF8C8